METFVSLLRGINVGGHRKVPMAELRALHERLGYTQVASYIASGNVVFVAEETNGDKNAADIRAAISDTFGFDDIPVMLRTHNEISNALRASPFRDSPVESKHRFIGFLSAVPEITDVDGDALSPDVFTVDGDHVHVLLPNGAAKSKLTTNYLEEALGVQVTMRNHRTVEKIISLTTARW